MSKLQAQTVAGGAARVPSGAARPKSHLQRSKNTARQSKSCFLVHFTLIWPFEVYVIAKKPRRTLALLAGACLHAPGRRMGKSRPASQPPAAQSKINRENNITAHKASVAPQKAGAGLRKPGAATKSVLVLPKSRPRSQKSRHPMFHVKQRFLLDLAKANI